MQSEISPPLISLEDHRGMIKLLTMGELEDRCTKKLTQANSASLWSPGFNNKLAGNKVAENIFDCRLTGWRVTEEPKYRF